MVAECIGIAVVAFRIVAWEDFGAGATGEGVSVVAGTVIRVGTRITAGTDRQHGRTFGSSCAVAPNVAVAARNSGVAADARVAQACTIAAGDVVPIRSARVCGIIAAAPQCIGRAVHSPIGCGRRSARIAHTVVDVRTGLAVAVEAIWTRVTCEARCRRRLVVAGAIARAVRTAVRIRACCPITAVP